MNLFDFLHRWRERRAERAAARRKYAAIIYFDGPITRWNRSRINWLFEEHPGGLRIPRPITSGEWRGRMMPEPDEREVIQRREFRSELFARIWVIARLRGFDTTKIVGEVRRL